MWRLVAAACAAGATLFCVPAAGAAPAPPPTPPVPHAGPLRLVTGEQVALRPSPQGGSVVAARETHAGFTVATVGGRHYAMPVAAQFYAGRFLDRELFDVERLAALGPTGRIPVRLTGGTAPVPGVTVTGRSGPVRTGYLTGSSVAAFGAAVRAQYRRDRAPRAARPTALLGARRIALNTTLDAPRAATVHPDFPQGTLVLKVLDDTGKPVPTEATLTNVDDVRRYDQYVDLDGEARLSVPVGHYTASFSIVSVRTGKAVDVVARNATVTAAGATLTLDARTATVMPTVSTPRPSTLQDLQVGYGSKDAAGRFGASFATSGDLTHGLFVSPVAPAPAGQTYQITHWVLASPAGVAPYSYDLAFVDPGIPTDQHHTAAAAGLATLHVGYHSERPGRVAQPYRLPILPAWGETFYSYGVTGLSTPVRRTEYVSTAEDVRWVSSVVAVPHGDALAAGLTFDIPRHYGPGSSSDVDWLAGPLAPGVHTPATEVLLRGRPSLCYTCRTADTIGVYLDPYLDSAGHFGSTSFSFGDDPPSPQTHFQLYRDGTLIGEVTNGYGGTFPAPAGRASYRFVYATDRSADGVLTSTHSTLEETFAAAAGSGPVMPATLRCFTAEETCRVLPVLRDRVSLPESLSDRVPAGKVTVPFTVDHVAGATATAIATAGLATSIDGKTWTAAPVKALGHGRFSAVVDNAKPGAAVSLRVTATDAGGTTLTETTTNAYVVAGS